ncbi:hypothetical protein HKO22_01390 [Peptoniphilus sp. AGMB00490]|uniref:MutL protein n=1 Tax=Peptoniphilus faecalis TaxID=2731255 RepID=A0A848R9A4_9FIRM|nr:glutamate mutase L [Peptoniphilus faecalis]NMW84398.1 hypothetical protein [Peptoniphilus faecalis]
MQCYMLVDFGSTFTKLTLVDKDEAKIICRTKSYTTINTYAIEGYKKALTEMKNIIHAPGMDEVDEKTGKILMPTPTAVLMASNLISVGIRNLKGLGKLIVADIGGATTDIHSMSEPIVNNNYLYDGLGETFKKGL